MRFGENNVLSKIYRYIYEFWGVRGGWTYSTVHFLFIIQKHGKSTRAWPILKSNSTSYWYKKNFLGWIIKNLRNFLFLYEVSIVVLIDFIAILLTPGIFLIQIVNTNNPNMYLINFHSKNIIKMRFPKVGFLKFQTNLNHSLFIATRWNKLCWHQQRLHNNVTPSYLKKK